MIQSLLATLFATAALAQKPPPAEPTPVPAVQEAKAPMEPVVRAAVLTCLQKTARILRRAALAAKNSGKGRDEARKAAVIHRASFDATRAQEPRAAVVLSIDPRAAGVAAPAAAGVTADGAPDEAETLMMGDPDTRPEVAAWLTASEAALAGVENPATPELLKVPDDL